MKRSVTIPDDLYSWAVERAGGPRRAYSYLRRVLIEHMVREEFRPTQLPNWRHEPAVPEPESSWSAASGDVKDRGSFIRAQRPISWCNHPDCVAKESEGRGAGVIVEGELALLREGEDGKKLLTHAYHHVNAELAKRLRESM